MKYTPLALFVFATLLLHDHNLYPALDIPHQIILSSLRFLLLALPILAAIVIAKSRKRYLRFAGTVLFLAFIPYALYGVTEIRHIAELCPLGTGEYYADKCADESWQLLPPLLYAGFGIASYMISLSIARLRAHDWRLGALTLYCALSVQFALQSRLNIWSPLTEPHAVATEAANTLGAMSYWSNSFMLLIVFVFLAYYCYPRISSGVLKKVPNINKSDV
jgi:uncharacterized membrane protein